MADEERELSEEDRILDHFNERLRLWSGVCLEEHERIEDLENFVADRDHQWSEWDRKVLDNPDNPRPRVSINGMMRVINSISGQEISGRLQPQPYPRTPAFTDWALMQKDALRSLRDWSEAAHQESQAVRQLLIGGYGWVAHPWDDTNDGDTNYHPRPEPVWNFLWDPLCKEANLADRRGQMHLVWLGEGELGEEWGEAGEDLVASAKLAGVHGAGAYGWGGIAQGTWYNRELREIAVIRYEWKQKEWEYTVADPGLDRVRMAQQQAAQGMIDGPTLEGMLNSFRTQPQELVLNPAGFERYRRAYAEIFEEPLALGRHYSRRRKWTYRFAYIANGKVLEHGTIPIGRFTYECITGIPWVSRDRTRWRGLGDLMKDGQQLRNRIFSLMLELVAKSPKGMVLVEEDSGLDLDAIETQLSKPYPIIVVPKGSLANEKVRIVPPGGMSYEWLKGMIDLADRAVLEPTGLSEASLGQIPDPRRVSGTTVSSLMQAAGVALAPFFDNIGRYRKRAGLIGLAYIEVKFDEESLAELIGPAAYQMDPVTQQPVSRIPPKSQWPSINRLRIKVDESPIGPTSLVESYDRLDQHGLIQQIIQPGLGPGGGPLMDAETFIEWLSSMGMQTDIKQHWMERYRERDQAFKAAQAQQGGGQPPPQGPAPAG